MIRRLLIANRGEIACRIARTARDQGIETVAVYSDADRHSAHVAAADMAQHIGPAPAAQSYLDSRRILDAARKAGADAIHPGYGFLSENADFARAVKEAGLIFIGPDPDVIDAMGDKRTARLMAAKEGIPVVPGYDGEDMTPARLIREAESIGTPLMVKATAGGGGRGLRRVNDLADIAGAITEAERESGMAFGASDLILEKLVEPARHVEVQIIADTHGTVLHLGERDCSAQRRHQKVIEEAPCPTIDETTRGKLCEAAVILARASGYTGAGTVEFLVGPENDFYFLEMNTRLQVEHPVTEMVTGLDLVALQLSVAAGDPLPLTQDDIRFSGHAIEARLYAEDAANGFLPQTGRLALWTTACGPHRRTDSGVRSGDDISPFYDPMIAKLIAWGTTRTEARQRLLRQIAESAVVGLVTNKGYLYNILAGGTFAAAKHNVRTLDTDSTGTVTATSSARDAFYAAALAQVMSLATFPHQHLAGWRTIANCPDFHLIDIDGEHIPVSLVCVRSPSGWQMTLNTGAEDMIMDVATLSETAFRITHGAENLHIFASRDGDMLFADTGIRHIAARIVTHAAPDRQDRKGTGLLTAPMDGLVVTVERKDGDSVKTGDLILIIEAMKMEHRIQADRDGTLAGLAVGPGDQVKNRQELATISTPSE
ncbi:acetyl/propionyl/methylcrotonyl-CoA carboxylase subunit alpha [Eilatimonas milleporae]|uniref:Geranyl-CoA carboxylase alpha subunit n=1 Tax=Eilatimonas milleporae TaxID=911205 RepID=A0A3M0C7G2_9PROT|nr:biotin carboxylase N-terminal domain-containing protein [Eilatimonas milleporae]RMB04815.1 geranyl-CoA carboxylase alpha subunit [Eilatimonas milleporae]